MAEKQKLTFQTVRMSWILSTSGHKPPKHPLSTPGKKHSRNELSSAEIVTAPDGSAVEASALLNNTSSASFVSEHLAQSLSSPCTSQSIHISGTAGLSPWSSLHCPGMDFSHHNQYEDSAPAALETEGRV